MKKSKMNGTIYINSLDAKFFYGEGTYREYASKKGKVNSELIDYKIYDKPHGTSKKLIKLKDDLGNETGKTREIERILRKACLVQCPDLWNVQDRLNIVEEKGKLFTKDIINITFKATTIRTYNKHPKSELSKLLVSGDKMRTDIYTKGIEFDGTQYVYWKRTGSKARTGSALFIRKGLEDSTSYARMGLEYDDNTEIDIAQLLAYEGLSLSGCEGVLDIQPNEILIIDDWKHTFKDNVMVISEDEEHNVVCNEEDNYDVTNDLWDGQCLLDKSKFKSARKLIDKKSGAYAKQGMLLLRNRGQLKGCAFNTSLSEYYSKNKIKTVVDMFGIEHNASDIKLVITPNCLKFLKQKDHKKYGGDIKACYLDWLANLDTTFGIVKTEHGSKLGDSQLSTYQFINSLPLTTEKMKELLVNEVKYVNDLYYDDNKFIDFIREDVNNDFKQTIANLYEKNNDIFKTDIFNSYRNNCISSYQNKVKHGRIRITKADYFTMCAMPYEMLQATHKDRDKIKPLMTGQQVYTTYFNDKEDLGCFRNPNIASCNVYWCTNVYQKKIDRWFNFTPNIVVVNNYDVNVMERLQSCDFDSDTCFLTNEQIIVDGCKVSYKHFKTVIDNIDGQKTLRTFTLENIAKVDHIISKNFIGKIVNLSQIVNSLLMEEIRKGENADKELIIAYVTMLAKLSVLSCKEIDKAKKLFNIDTEKELLKIKKQLQYIVFLNKNGERISVYDYEVKNNITIEEAISSKLILKEQVIKYLKPQFMKTKSQKLTSKAIRRYNCPMDDIRILMKDGLKDLRETLEIRTEKLDFKDLLDETDCNTYYNTKQVKMVCSVAKKLCVRMKNLNTEDKQLDDFMKGTFSTELSEYKKEQYNIAIAECNDDAIEELKLTTKKIKKSTMMYIIKKVFARDKDVVDFGISLLTLLARYDNKTFMSCFKTK